MALSTKLSDEELPLKFEEIVDVKTYDKMRPPRPGGMSYCHNCHHIVDLDATAKTQLKGFMNIIFLQFPLLSCPV